MEHELRVVGDVTAVNRLQVVTRLATLEDVVRWGGELVDVIVQDEYTHDVIARAHDAYVVFDCT